MTTSTSLSRMRLIGKLCRRGAWIIVVAGLAVIVFLINTSIYNNQANSGQNINDLLNTFAIALLIAIPIFFFFLILYAIGALFDYISAEKNSQAANDERIEITPLPEMR
jgi:hypothetical protein